MEIQAMQAVIMERLSKGPLWVGNRDKLFSTAISPDAIGVTFRRLIDAGLVDFNERGIYMLTVDRNVNTMQLEAIAALEKARAKMTEPQSDAQNWLLTTTRVCVQCKLEKPMMMFAGYPCKSYKERRVRCMECVTASQSDVQHWLRTAKRVCLQCKIEKPILMFAGYPDKSCKERRMRCMDCVIIVSDRKRALAEKISSCEPRPKRTRAGVVPPSDENHSWCSSCKRMLPNPAFSPRVAGCYHRKLASQCKTCRNVADHKRRENNAKLGLRTDGNVRAPKRIRLYDIQEKQCLDCHQTKALAEFYFCGDKDKYKSRSSYCRPCYAIRQQANKRRAKLRAAQASEHDGGSTSLAVATRVS